MRQARTRWLVKASLLILAACTADPPPPTPAQAAERERLRQEAVAANQARAMNADRAAQMRAQVFGQLHGMAVRLQDCPDPDVRLAAHQLRGRTEAYFLQQVRWRATREAGIFEAEAARSTRLASRPDAYCREAKRILENGEAALRDGGY